MSKPQTEEQAFARLTKIHNGEYEYVKGSYSSTNHKIKIICPEHGLFEQAYGNHKSGSACARCSKINQARKPISEEKVFAKMTKMHGGKYEYVKGSYTKAVNNIKIICPEHGLFEQKSSHHTRGRGCPKCATIGHFNTEKKAFDKCTKVHNGKYEYVKGSYTKSVNKIKIICPEHGLFEQLYRSHITGIGCIKCANPPRLEKEVFAGLAKVHNGKYEYVKGSYTKSVNKIKIICPEHGLFEQQFTKHVNGSNCPKCAITTCAKNITKSESHVFAELTKIHNGKYEYVKGSYTKSKEKMKIICPEHGLFEQTPDGQKQGKGCKKCTHSISKAEQEIANYIKSLGLAILQSDRKILKGKELDIVIPELKIAIEYNGVYWHSEQHGKGFNYHASKTAECNKMGYRLVHIWEDDFMLNKAKELRFIKHLLGKDDSETIFGRKCQLRVIPNSESTDFLNTHHVQGVGSASVTIGTFFKGQLVACTQFTIRKNGAYELIRHACSCNVIGSLGKAVSFFAKHYTHDIYSFCDLTRYNGKSYQKAGFIQQGRLKPDYKYVVDGVRRHKFGFRRRAIHSQFPHVYSEDLTEKEMMKLLEYPRIWDCGKIRYQWSK